MVDLNKIIDALAADRNLVFQFFAFFSRFEYSLKRSGFLKPGEKAEPNWNKYADSLQGRFVEVQDQVFQDAVAFLLKKPPETQIVYRQQSRLEVHCCKGRRASRTLRFASCPRG